MTRRTHTKSTSRVSDTWLRLAFLTALTGWLLVCTGVPLSAMLLIHPMLGAGLAVVALVAWIQLGPPPAPGLGSAIVAFSGLCAILIVLFVCLAGSMRVWA